MNKKIVLCVILSCLVFLTVLSSCEPKIEKKYEVLFAGSSDSASALLIPLDFEEIEYDTKARDTDLWPDEMTIEFEGVSYDCYLKYFLGDNCCCYYFDKTENTRGGFFTLNEYGDVVGFYSNTRLSDEEKNNREQISESEAIGIAEQVFRKHFNVDYSQYTIRNVQKNETIPSVESYDIHFKKKYDSLIELNDGLYVTIGLYGEVISFVGGSIGSVTPPEEKPNVDEIQHSIEERIIDLLNEQKISFSGLEVNVKHMTLCFSPIRNRYCVDCYLTYDCKGTVDGIEKEFHDYIEVIVVCNDLK